MQVKKINPPICLYLDDCCGRDWSNVSISVQWAALNVERERLARIHDVLFSNFTMFHHVLVMFCTQLLCRGIGSSTLFSSYNYILDYVHTYCFCYGVHFELPHNPCVDDNALWQLVVLVIHHVAFWPHPHPVSPPREDAVARTVWLASW